MKTGGRAVIGLIIMLLWASCGVEGDCGHLAWVCLAESAWNRAR